MPQVPLWDLGEHETMRPRYSREAPASERTDDRFLLIHAAREEAAVDYQDLAGDE